MACGGGQPGGGEQSVLPVPEVEPESYDPHPLTPSILRDTALVGDDARYTRPYVPGVRTTMDGRVGIRVQGGPPGPEFLATSFSFYLLAPEKVTEPIMNGPAGAQILASATSFDVEFPPAFEDGVAILGHHTICDPTQEFAVEGERPNPYACGPDGENDCYDIHVISSTGPFTSAQMWGTPVTVEVENPKTPDARIVRAELGEPVMGFEIPLSSEWTEPAVTIDGRLLTGRTGNFPRKWTHPETGELFERPYDLQYSVLPDDTEPCDVTGWIDFHPLSHAPYDPMMVGRYGIAAYPFRDTEGNPIPDGEDMGGSYPWVDREGNNVFMTGMHGRLIEQSATEYPRRCVQEGCEELDEKDDWNRGFSVAGLWTHGKFVHLDGLINNVDWAVGVAPQSHYLVDLYKTLEGEPTEVRVGGGRFIDANIIGEGPYPPEYPHNANVLDSLQNLLTQFATTTPVTPRDVVWHMSNGVGTDKIAFDDLLDPAALIVSNMQPSITQLYTDTGESMGIPKNWNGQVRELTSQVAFVADYVLDPEAHEDIHLQNGATSLTLNVPAFGVVRAGTGRTEPVALGGVQGRGFFLSGDNAIRYALPPQAADVLEQDRYVGVFIESRSNEGAARSLFAFPDGSELWLVEDSQVFYRAGDVTVRGVNLPERSHTRGWMHLGLLVANQGKSITLFVDGFAFDRFDSARSLFGVGEGDFIVGQTERRASVRGWIDELVVLVHGVSPEVACNHARGTLVRLEGEGEWAAVAERFPTWAHAGVAAAAGEAEGARYACYHDYSDDFVAHLGNIPSGAVSMREAITFPEGPLRVGAPRPDSSQNAFCLTCHTADSKGGLSLAALEFRPDVNAEDDPRRQPMQPPRRVFGNIPAGWIAAGKGAGSPAEPLTAPPEGLVIDHWVLPQAE